jgi:hypothetical protein
MAWSDTRRIGRILLFGDASRGVYILLIGWAAAASRKKPASGGE